jgi:methylmalonyl-CoA mutase cobalamin-binding subunit
LPSGTGAPRILLTTPLNEQHLLGLLMAEALWTMDGANCLSLGTQMPLGKIVQAAVSHGSDVVAIALSSAFPNRQALPLIRELRQRLPEQIALWVGGAGIKHLSGANGVRLLPQLTDAQNALNDWYRQTRGVGLPLLA